MAEKVSLRYYILEKGKIKYDNCYRNNTNSLFFARARTNSIKLEEHKGRGIVGYDKTCKVCNEKDEDIVHFLMDCKKLETIRNYDLINNDISSSEHRMGYLLFKNERHQEIGEMIKKTMDQKKTHHGKEYHKWRHSCKPQYRGYPQHRGCEFPT